MVSPAGPRNTLASIPSGGGAARSGRPFYAGRPALVRRPSAWLRAAPSSGAAPSIRQSSARRSSPSTRRTTVTVLPAFASVSLTTVSYTHLRAHETRHDLVCRLLLE